MRSLISSTIRVAGAELRRALARGGVARWLVGSCVLAWSLGIVVVYVSTIPDIAGNTPFGVSDVAGTAILAALLTFMIATSNFVTRDIEEGVITGEKVFLPSPPAIFVGRLLSWATLSLGLSAASLLVPSVVGVMVSTIARDTLQGFLIKCLIASIASACVSVFIYCMALILRKGAYVVAASLFLLVILPLMFTALGMFVPALLQFAQGVSSWLIGTVAVQAVVLPGSLDGVTTASFFGAWGRLMVWVVGCATVSYLAFAREAFDYRR